MNVNYKNVRCMWWFQHRRNWLIVNLMNVWLLIEKGTIVQCTEMNLIDCESIQNCLTAHRKEIVDDKLTNECLIMN